MKVATRTMLLGTLLALTLAGPAPRADALVLGQVDTFASGTTEGWQVGLLGAAHPAPPTVVNTGGPTGSGDAYLRLSAVGGSGPGSRLSVLNLGQWAGNYTGLGIATLEMDLINLGSTDLSIRLMLENPLGGPPTDVAVSNFAATLSAGGAWTHIAFTIDPSEFTALAGDAGTALASATVLRIFHATGVGAAEPVVGQLGVDNISAGPAAPPRPVDEPSTAPLAVLALLAILARRRAPVGVRVAHGAPGGSPVVARGSAP